MVGMKYPMSGVAGGMDGSPNELITNVDTERAHKVECMANGVPHAAGEAFRYLYGGGGGWGDPLARDPARVLDDVLDELVSVEAARPRLRRRLHGQPRSARPRASTPRPRGACGRGGASRGPPHRHRRRRHLHRLHPRPRRPRGRALQGADHAAGPVARRDERDRRDRAGRGRRRARPARARPT